MALAAAVSLAGPADAQPVAAVDARSSLYLDDDETVISTSTLAGKLDPVSRLTVNGRFLVDVISTASVDVVSAATERWDEIRWEGLGGLAYHDDRNTIAGTYIYSVENDWRSHTGSLSLGRDFFDHQLTLGIGANATFNEVGRADDDNFSERMTALGGSLSATVVASKNDLVGATYSLTVVDGYQASPYRFVRFVGPIAAFAIAQPEIVPERRFRHALGLRYNRHLFSDTALRSHLRGYLDSWGIASVTAGTELAVGLGDLEVAPFVRGYAQTKAGFYEGVYDARQRYMTSDRELGAFVDAFGGLRLGYAPRDVGPFQEIRAELKGTVFAFRFFDFPLLERRLGVIPEAAVGASF